MATSENSNNGGNNSSDSKDAPFVVGTNITLQLPAGTSLPSSSEPFAVGTNLTIQFTDSSGQPQGQQLSSDRIVGTNSAPWSDRNASGSDNGSSRGSDLLTGSPAGANNQSLTGNSSGYTWDFSRVAGSESGLGGSSDLNSLFQQSPFGRLQEVGINSFEDVFGSVGSAGGGENPFGGAAVGGNPFDGGVAGVGNPFGGGGFT